MLTLTEYRKRLERPSAIVQLVGPEAPKGMTNVFASSYDRLSPLAQQIFTVLGWLRGTSCPIEVVRAMGTELGAAEDEINTAIEALLKAKLLQPLVGESQAIARVSLHPVLHQFANMLFQSLDEQRQENRGLVLAARYAAYAQNTADTMLRRDEENIQGAFDWLQRHRPKSDTVLADLVDGMCSYWYMDYRNAEGIRWLREGEAILCNLGSQWQTKRCEVLYWLSYYEYQQGDNQASRADAEKGLHVSRTTQERSYEGYFHRQLGDLGLREGHTAQAKQQYADYLTIMREVGARRSEGVALGLLGNILRQQGDVAGAQRNYADVLTIMREVGARREEGVALYNLALVDEQLGNIDRAEQEHRLSLQIAQQLKLLPDIPPSQEDFADFLLRHRGEQGTK